MTHAWLASTRWIDASEPRIVSCAARLRRSTPTETVRETFAFVRDAIAHSCDVATDAVPLAASAVLEAGTGLCFAKSHLLAALLRASSIPTALGYVRLRDPRAASGFCLHGFDVVELPGHGLVRVDARGDNATVSTTFVATPSAPPGPTPTFRASGPSRWHDGFDPPRESLAYWPVAEGEAFLDGAFVEPVAAVVDAYARARTLRELLADLPDLRALAWPSVRSSLRHGSRRGSRIRTEEAPVGGGRTFEAGEGLTMRTCVSLVVWVALGVTVAACTPSEDAEPAPDGGTAGTAGTGGAAGTAGTGGGGSAGSSGGSGGAAGGGAGTGGGAAGSSCPAKTGGPTSHQGSIVADETWTADKSPHLVLGTMGVSAKLTIEPCAEILLGSVSGITVGANGLLVAEGQPDKRIHIAASDPSKPFAQLGAHSGGTVRLAYVDIENGGDPQNSVLDTTGTLYMQGADQSLPTQPTLFVDHVTVKGSRSIGVHLQGGAGFAPGSQALTVTGSVSYPLDLSPRAIDTVPTGAYTGNGVDEILLPGGGGYDAVQEDSTMHERGVPYRVGNSLSFGYLFVESQLPGAGYATLTIEPGVTLRFKKGGELIVETYTGTLPARGALIAAGTPAKPIVFTSAEPSPAAGDWIGVSFNQIPAPVDKMEHTRVEYAGGLTSSGSSACNLTPIVPDAAIRVRGLPSGQFVTNSTIADSAAHGIDRGWRNDTKIDFLPTNTFVAVAACLQTFPSNTNGSCPDPVPCPK